MSLADLPPGVFRAYLVGFYRSREPGRYIDAGIYSEESPSMLLHPPGDEADRSRVLLEVRSARSYQRAHDELLRILEQRQDLGWVKMARTFMSQARAGALLRPGTILSGRAP